MTIDELGNIGELVGAVATVGTLVYLALQIRANTLATKHQASINTSERIIHWFSRLGSSPEDVRCWIDGQRSFTALSLEDQLRFAALIGEVLAPCESALDAAKSGDAKPEAADAVRQIIVELFRAQGVREWWDRHPIFTRTFTTEVDQLSKAARNIAEDVPGRLPFHIPTKGT